MTEGLGWAVAIDGSVGAVMGRAGAQSAQPSAHDTEAMSIDLGAMAERIVARARSRCPGAGNA